MEKRKLTVRYDNNRYDDRAMVPKQNNGNDNFTMVNNNYQGLDVTVRTSDAFYFSICGKSYGHNNCISEK